MLRILNLIGLQICDFAIKMTSGDGGGVGAVRNEVAISVRQPLLNVWVQAKQLASTSIGKGLGCDDDVSFNLAV